MSGRAGDAAGCIIAPVLGIVIVACGGAMVWFGHLLGYV